MVMLLALTSARITWAQCSVNSPNGSLDYVDCNGLGGWAFDGANFNQTVNIDIYVDGTKTYSGIVANGDRQDLVGAFGTSAARYHGFNYQFPANASWKNGQNHTISVRICGSNNEIGGSPRTAGGCSGGTTTNPPVTPPTNPPPSGNCAFSEGQFLFTFYGEQIYAHYYNGYLFAAYQDASQGFKAQSWMQAASGAVNFDQSKVSCFATSDPRTSTPTNPPVTPPTNPPVTPPSGNCGFSEGQFLFNFYGEQIYAHYYNGVLFAASQDASQGFKAQSWMQQAAGSVGFDQSKVSCFAQNDPHTSTPTNPPVTPPTNPPVTPPSGSCGFSEGQFLFTFYGEQIYAHYYNGYLFAAYQDASQGFKAQSWMQAASGAVNFDQSKVSCFATSDPRTSTPTNPPVTPPTNPPSSGNCSVSSPNGSLDGADCDGVRGWAFDGSNLNQTVTIDVYIDGNKTYSGITANGDRQDLVGAFGNAAARYHGFNYSFPADAPWKNGQNHTISVRICGANTELGGSPKTANCSGGTNNLTNPPGEGRLSAGGVGRRLYPGDPNLDPSWDWTVSTYNLWYNTGSIHPQSPSNPFLFNSSGRLHNDMYSGDGWMLVARDFGTPTAAIGLPFYILYNKFRGVLRAVIYYPDDQPSVTNHVVSLKFADNISNHPALFNFAEKTASNSFLDQYNPNSIQKITTEANPGGFIIADFNIIGYDPALFDPNNHAYDDLGFSISVYHVNVTDANLYSQLTINGTVQPQSLGEFSDQLGSVSGFFTKTFEDVEKIIKKDNLSNVFDLINVGNEALNGLFGGGGGYNVILKGDISTQGTLSTPTYAGTIDLYVKPKASNNTPNYSPLSSIPYGLLNLNQLNITVHKNFVNNGGCYNLSGQAINCPQYSANGIDINPIINLSSGLKYQGASASYFSDQTFQLKSTVDVSGSGCSNISNPNLALFKCLRYTKTRSGIENKNWNEGFTDDVFSTIGVNFTFYHPGYGPPFSQANDPNPIIVYKEFKLGRSFIDGGRTGVSEEVDDMIKPYPNPFNHVISIPIRLKDIDQLYELQILSMEGKQIWSRQSLSVSAETIVLWDGKNSDGLSMPSGMYLCKIIQKGIIINTYKIILQGQ